MTESGGAGGTRSFTSLAIVTVGLPARGKTYLARKITRYLNWLGYPSRIFNVGNVRRQEVGAFKDAAWFDPSNIEFSNKRTEIAMIALQDMLNWFDQQEQEAVNAFHQNGGISINNNNNNDNNNPATTTTTTAAAISSSASNSSVSSLDRQEFRAGGHAFIAVYDATNSTRERRKTIYESCTSKGVQVMFIESVCDDMNIILSNIKEVKLSSPDYANIDPDAAVQDFISRIKHYESTYEPLTQEENVPYIALCNVGQQIQMNMIRGYLQSRIVYFLMNLNITKRHIYFARHGESEFNLAGRIGGDADLSSRGWAFAKKLPELFESMYKKHDRSTPTTPTPTTTDSGGKGGDSLKAKMTVWTSTLKRTVQTSSFLPYTKMQWKQLDELDSGVCDGLTYEEIEKMFPEEFMERDGDKYNYRYKGGESYRDLVQRLEPVIMELERHHEAGHSIFIIGHQAILRAIYAYYMNYSQSELPYLKIPLHTVIRLTPKAYGCIEERFPIDIPAVDTYRGKMKESNSPPNSPQRSEIPEGFNH